MRLRRRSTSDEVRRVVLAAVASALENRAQESQRKPRLRGVRALAAGAVLYTAGKAVVGNRELLREQLGGDGARRDRDDEPVEDDEFEDDEFEDEEPVEDDDEPLAERDEFEDEEPEDDEPRAERDEPEDEEPEDEDYEDEDYDEEDEGPLAEEDEDFDEEDEESATRRPPARPRRKRSEARSDDLPSRPSRSRAAVRT
jgi:hypothetical protein